MPRDSLQTALSDIVPVILAGGAGSRLWPLSTTIRPKPFLKLPGGDSFLQKTVARVAGMQPPFVICNARHRPLVMQQLDYSGQLILEPQGRGTAPALAAAAHFLARQGERLILALPCDHAIGDQDAFLQAVANGVKVARDGWLVTFGIKPSRPSPHYGYIRAGETLADGVYKAASFIEKPDRAAASACLSAGDCYWNSGIFLFSATSYLEQLKTLQPEIHDTSYKALAQASRLKNSIFLNENVFSACPALSIDYAVMEKAPKCAVIPVSMGWRDLGTWPSLLASLAGRR